MKKILVICGVLFALAVVALVVFVFAGLGPAIKAAVEGVGSRVTKTEVTLKSADVSLSSGEGELAGLVVGNPEGFKTPSAIELGRIHVKIDTATVTSDTVVIESVLIDGPHVTYEVSNAGTTNIGTIQDNVDAFRGGGGGEGAKTGGGGHGSGTGGGGKAPESAGTSRKFIIKDLVIRNGRVDVSASVLGGRSAGATLREIHLRNLGDGEGGATPAEIAKEVLSALTAQAIDAVAGLGIEGLAGEFKKTLGGAVEGALGGVRDILGGKKKNK